MAERSLTAGERAMVSSAFGTTINLDAVRITDQAYFSLPFGVGQTRPMAPDGRVYWPSGLADFPYSNDFSLAPVPMQAVFMHEMSHVWQSQQGINVAARGLMPQILYSLGISDPYSMSAVTPAHSFDSLGLEQQAEIIKYIYLLENGNYGDTLPIALIS